MGGINLIESLHKGAFKAPLCIIHRALGATQDQGMKQVGTIQGTPGEASWIIVKEA